MFQENKNGNDKISWLYVSLMMLHAGVFLFFYWAIGFYNRVGRDDTLFIYLLNKFGFFHTIKHCYYSLEGNVSSIIVYCTVDSIIQHLHSLIAFHVIAIFLLYISIYCLFNTLCKMQIISINKPYQFLLPLMLLSPLFLFSPKISELWFWPMAMDIYLFPIVVLLWAIYFLLLPQTLSKVAAFALFIFLGDEKINYTLLLITVFGLLLLYNYYRNRKINKSFLLAFAGITIGLLVYFSSHGNSNRQETESVGISMNSFSKAFLFDYHYIFFDFFSPVKLAHIGLFLLPFTLMGLKFDKSKLPGINNSTIALVVAGLNFMLVVENCALYYLATGKGAIFPRIMSLNYFFLIVSIACLFSFLGNRYHRLMEKKPVRPVIAFLLFLPVLIYAKTFRHEFPVAKKVAIAYDKRIELFKSYSGKETNIQVLYLDSLPQRGITNHMDLTVDTAHPLNKQYQLRYDLKCDIAVKRKQDSINTPVK